MVYLKWKGFYKGKEIYEFKDLLLGKVCIPKPDDEFDDVYNIGKKMERAIELNEIV
jgi:hypothetical protein